MKCQNCGLDMVQDGTPPEWLSGLFGDGATATHVATYCSKCGERTAVGAPKPEPEPSTTGEKP